MGNPGQKYLKTRHNAGFIFLDNFKEEYCKKETWKDQYLGLFINTSVEIYNQTYSLLLLKPQTFMNLSGNSVQQCIEKENLSLKNTIVFHDDIELPFGEIKWKEGGGHRGHNGLRDIIQKCGNDFYRLRIGIGKPDSIPVSEYVLSAFTDREWEEWNALYSRGKEILFRNFFDKSLSSLRI